ncbi:MAG TPA: proton-conducting transporter membrane subunit [Symbiobacteriaceae bacterium]|nr:proton-conducting transporter membrane subunit [Symbiobacteriaceae bacterium]
MLLALILAVLCLGLVTLAVWPWRPRGAAVTGVAALAAAGFLTGVLGFLAFAQGPVEARWFAGQLLPGLPSSPFFRADALSGLFLLLLAVIPCVAGLHAAGWLVDRSAGEARHFYSNLILLTMAMTGVVTAADWIFFLLAWELMTLASYFLVLQGWRQTERPVKAGWVYLVTTHIASGGILVAATALSFVGGDYSFEAAAGALQFMLAQDPVMGHLMIGLFAAGFLTKAGVWPASFWLPEAYAAAPSPASAVFSGLMAKMGLYGLIRILFYAAPGVAGWGIVLLALGAASMLIGNIRSLSEQEAGRLVAQSSIGQIGYVLLALGMGVALAQRAPALSALAFAAGVYHLINHSAFKSLLFLTVGSIERAAGTTDLRRLGGLALALPAVAISTLVGALAIAGTPPLNGFASKWLIYRAAVFGGRELPVLALCGVLAIFLSTVSLAAYLKYFGMVFLGEPAVAPRRVPLPMRFAEGMLGLVCVGLGLVPGAVVSVALRALPGAAATADEILGGVLGAGTYQPLAVLAAIALGFALALGVKRAAGAAVRPARPWYGGEQLAPGEARYGSAHLYQPFQTQFSLLLRPLFTPRASAPAWLGRALDADAWMYRPLTRGFLWCADRLAALRWGHVWQLVAVVAVVAILLGVEGGV